MPESPVAYFIPDNPQTLRNLRMKLLDARDTRRGNIAGGAAEDWPDYKERVGEIRGLDLALRILNEVEQDMRN